MNTPPNRVLRGGFWVNGGRFCRSALRDGYEPGLRVSNVGFRPVLKKMTPNTPPNRVLRGGSWFSIAGFCRSAYRSSTVPDGRSRSCGFRPVLKPMTPTKL